MDKEKRKELAEYNLNRSYERMQREKRAKKIDSSISAVSFILKLVILFMIIGILISALRGNLRLPSFTSFLEGLSDFDVIPNIPFLSFTAKTLGNWDIVVWNSFDLLGFTFPAFILRFNWLRDFFAYFLNIINVFVFLVNGFIALINMCIFFMRWLFL